MRRLTLAAAAALAAACAPALREPPSVAVLAERGAPAAGGASELLAAGDARWALRPDLAAVREAESLYLRAAEADPVGATGLIGAIRAKTWLVDHDPNVARRAEDAVSAVHAAQWCGRRRPDLPACDFWLAIAVGLQAREVRTTAEDGLDTMIAALERAIVKDPGYERAGPHRVLALVLLRAPGWPLGPGDADAGLEHARAAVRLAPDYAPNVLALAEALADVGDGAASRDAYEKAREMAVAARAAGDPDAAEWIAEAEARLTPR